MGDDAAAPPLADRPALFGRGPFFERTLERTVGAGRVDRRSARLFARSPHAGAHRFEIRSLDDDGDRHDAQVEPPNPRVTDGTFSLLYPQEAPGGRALEPATRYAFTVTHVASGDVLGEGAFRTAPEPGSRAARRFTFGVASCHNPFNGDGRLDAAALRTLAVAPEALEAAGASRLLLMGDQVYGDLPASLSLFDPTFFRTVAPPHRETIFDCTRDEVRSLFHERHRIFWKTDRFTDLMRGWATHPILDDHEIVDNFGSAPEHGTARWAAIREGALDAFHDYQARRVFGERRPPSFHHGFRHGDFAAFVMDLRSQRHVDGDSLWLFERSQLADLRAFMRANGDARALVIVLSVPILHVPDWMATLGGDLTGEGSDASDRWSHERAHGSRDALLALLEEHQEAHPEQRLVLVGGDIHVGCAVQFRWKESSARAVQLVSSALSNHQGLAHRIAAESAPAMRSVMGKGRRLYAEATLIEGTNGATRNPFGGLNFGVVDLETEGDETSVRLRLMSADEATMPSPITVFDSGAL